MSNVPQINIRVAPQGGNVSNQANTNVGIQSDNYKIDNSTFNTALAQKMEGDIALANLNADAFKQIPSAIFKSRELSIAEAENCRRAKEAADKSAKEAAELAGKKNAAEYYSLKTSLLDPKLTSEEKDLNEKRLKSLEVDSFLYGTPEQRKIYEDTEKDTLTKQALPFINKLSSKLTSEYNTGGITAAQSFLSAGRGGKRIATTADGQAVEVDDPDWAALSSLDPRVSALVYQGLGDSLNQLQTGREKQTDITRKAQEAVGSQYTNDLTQQKLTGNAPITPENQIQLNQQAQKIAIDQAQLNISAYNAETSRIAATTKEPKAPTKEQRSLIVQQYAPQVNQMVVGNMTKQGTPMKYDPNTLGSSVNLLAAPPTKDWLGKVKPTDPREAQKIQTMSSRFEPLFNQYLQSTNNPDEAYNKAVTALGLDIKKLPSSGSFNLQNADASAQDWGIYLNRFRSKILTDYNTRQGLQAIQFEYNKLAQ